MLYGRKSKYSLNTSKYSLRHVEKPKVLYSKNHYWLKIQFAAVLRLCKHWNLSHFFKFCNVLILSKLSWIQVIFNIRKFLTFGHVNVNWKLIQFIIITNFWEWKKTELNRKVGKIQLWKTDNQKNWFGH